MTLAQIVYLILGEIVNIFISFKVKHSGASSCARLKEEKGRTNGTADQNILYFQNDPRKFKWKQRILNTKNYPGDKEVFGEFVKDSLNLMNSGADQIPAFLGAVQIPAFPGAFLQSNFTISEFCYR